MLSHSILKEMMTSSLRSPMDLADRLALRLSVPQHRILGRFFDGEDPLEVEEVSAEHTLDAVAICALWRLLLIPGSKCITIASNERLGKGYLKYLQALTQAFDPAVAAVCRWPRWNTLKIGNQDDYGLRLVGNHPAHLYGIHESAITWVVLGARSSGIAFNATREVVEANRDFDGHRHIIMW